MYLPRYQFAKESEPELLKFLKVAKEQKLLGHGDLKKHELWNKLSQPVDPEILEKCVEQETANVIDLTTGSDDEEVTQQNTIFSLSPELINTNKIITESSDKSTISDVAFAIKENLDTERDLAITVEQLQKCASSDLEKLFVMLEETLNSEEIYCLGITLQSTVSDTVISIFNHYLLVPRIRKEYCEKLQQLMDEFNINYSSVLKEECLRVLQDLSEKEIETFLHYMKKMNIHFQSALARDFILAVGRLSQNYLTIIENLLNGQVEYEALNKLVEMLSNIAEDHIQDKNFGKLLMQTIEVLGPNVVHLEQPLKHIIAGHKSIWKSKLEKTFSSCYEDSLLFSQSFRD